jgi:hypothetical protein
MAPKWKDTSSPVFNLTTRLLFKKPFFTISPPAISPSGIVRCSSEILNARIRLLKRAGAFFSSDRPASK